MRRVLAAVVVAAALAGCGGGGESADTQSPAAPDEVTGGALTGVRVDVRRDPG